MKTEVKSMKFIKAWFIWLTSRKVLDAINSGASYEEVEEIVRRELRGAKERKSKFDESIKERSYL